MKALRMAWNAYLSTGVMAKDFSISSSQLEKDYTPSTSGDVSGKAPQAASSAAVNKVCLILK